MHDHNNVSQVCVLYMLPAPLKDDLHLVHKTVFTRLLLTCVFPPLHYPAVHYTLLEERSRQPSYHATLPYPRVHLKRRHDCVRRMDSVVCGHVISDLHRRVEENALAGRQWIIGMDQAALRPLEMVFGKRVVDSTEAEGAVFDKERFGRHCD